MINAPQPGQRVRLLKTSEYDGVFVSIEFVKGYDPENGWVVSVESAPSNLVAKIPDHTEIFITKDENRHSTFWRPADYYRKV